MPKENTDTQVDETAATHQIPPQSHQPYMPPQQPFPQQPMSGMCPPPQQPMPPQPPMPMCPPPMPPRRDGRGFAIAAFIISIIALIIAIGGVLIGLFGVGVGLSATTTCDTTSVENGTSTGDYNSNDSEDDNDMITPRLMSFDM